MVNEVPPPGPGNAETTDAETTMVPLRFQRFLPLFVVGGITIAVVGYMSGLHEPGDHRRSGAKAPIVTAGVHPAVNYADLPKAHLQPNAHWEQSLSQLKYERPGVFEPVVRTEAMKQAAFADRAKNRAYDGAPPTIPHPVDAQTATTCMACHGEGLKLGDRVASKMSHPHLTNCTQCHVEQAPIGIPVRVEPTLTQFVGLYRAGPGQRASPGAPPTIPHRTWMRDNCNSCHGVLTRPGLRTTHPWLTNCTQCHAPSAELDQRELHPSTPAK